MRTRLLTLAASLIACGHLLLAQQEPLPTFRTGVEAVQLDVFVTDADGRPVTDLTEDDFDVLENGAPRPLVAFSRVNLPIVQSYGRVDHWGVAPDVTANDTPEGRLYLFALDETGIEHALRARAFLRRFLEEQFQPHDRGAVVLTGRGLVTTGQPFTTDQRLLLAAFDRFSGGFDPRGQPCGSPTGMISIPSGPGAGIPMPRVNTNDVHVRNRLASLRQLAEFLAPLPGRKTMVYITQCLGFDMFDVVDYRGGVLSLAAEDAHAAMAAATRGNVVIYPIDPAGLDESGGFQALEARADLTALASATGGFALSNANGFSAAFERIVQDASTYYVLGFEAASTRRDGRYVRLDVRVNRPGVQVRTRDGYVAPMGSAPRAQVPVSPVIEALATPLAVRGLSLRVAAAPYRGSGRDAAVSLVIDVDTSTLPFSEADGMRRARLHVSYGATDLRDRAYPGAVHAIDLARPMAASDPASAQWLRIVSQLALPAGQHQLRVSAAGEVLSGSVVHDLEVPDFSRGPLVLSGLALTSVSALAVQTLRPSPGSGGQRAVRCRPPSCAVPLATDGAPSADDPLRDALPAPPTTVRDFERQDAIALFVEVYDLEPHALALGRHWQASEAWDRAFEHFRRAAIWAATRAAHREAIASYELALDALRQLPASSERIEQAIDLRFDLRHSCVPVGDHARILAHLRDADGAAQSIGDRRRLGWALAYRAHALYLAGDCAAANDAGEGALQIAIEFQDTMLQEWANVYLAQVYHWLGAYQRGVERLRQNVEHLEPRLAELGTQPKQFVNTRMMLAWCLAELGEFDEARARADEALAMAAETDSAYWMVHACCGAAVADLRRGAFDAAISAGERALDVCRGRDYDFLWGFPATILGAAYALARRPAAAIPLLEGVAAFGRLPAPVLVFLAQAYLAADRVDDAQRAVTRALEFVVQGGERGWETWGRCVLGDAHARAAKPQAASEAFRAGLDLAQRLGMRPLVAHCHRGLAAVARSGGHDADAAEHDRSALAIYRALGMTGWLTPRS